MSLPAKVYFPETLQATTLYNFSQVITSWNNLSASTKSIWNSYASLHTMRDKSGVVRTLSGFGLFMQSNIQLFSLGLQSGTLPVQPVGADILPSFTCVAYSNSIHVDFFPGINFPDSEMVIYAASPYQVGSSITKRDLYYITSFQAPNAGIFDLTEFFESSLFIDWPTYFNSHDFSVTFFISMVNSSTGIASQFYSQTFSFYNAPEIDWTNFSNSLNIVNTNIASGVPWAIWGNSIGVLISSRSSTQIVIRSTDFGQNWVSLGNLGTTAVKLACFIDDDGIAIVSVGNNGQIYRSTNSGASFALQTTIGSSGQLGIFALGSFGRWFLTGTNAGRVYYSDDKGLTWQSSLVAASIVQFRILFGGENGIILGFVVATRGLWRSVDNGISWTLLFVGIAGGSFWGQAYCGNGIFVFGYSSVGQFYRSTDYGQTFSLISVGISGQSLLNPTYIGNGLLVAIASPSLNIIQSLDYGLTWSVVKASGLPAASSFSNVFARSHCVFIPGSGYTLLLN